MEVKMIRSRLLLLIIAFALMITLVFSSCGNNIDNDGMNKNEDTEQIDSTDSEDKADHDQVALLRNLTPPGNVEHDTVDEFTFITVYNTAYDGFEEVVVWYEEKLADLGFENRSRGEGSDSEGKFKEFIGEINGLPIYITISNDGFMDTTDSGSVHMTAVTISFASS